MLGWRGLRNLLYLFLEVQCSAMFENIEFCSIKLEATVKGQVTVKMPFN